MKAIIILVFLYSFVACQYLNRNTTIYLQPSESLTLELDQFYDFPAVAFSMPENLSKENVMLPFELSQIQEKEYQQSKIIAQLKDESVKKKFFLAYRIENVNDKPNYQNIILLYYSLEIDETTNILKKEDIASVTLLENMKTDDINTLLLKATFINSMEGFISLSKSSVDLVADLIDFTYDVKVGLVLTKVGNIASTIVLMKTISKDSIYLVLNTYKQYYTIQLCSISNKQLKVLEEKRVYSQAVFNIDRYVVFYEQSTTQLKNLVIQPQPEKIVVNIITLPISTLVLQFCSMNEGHLYLIMQGERTSQTHFIKLQYFEQINKGQFLIIDQKRVNIQLAKQPVFVDEKNFIFQNNDRIYMYNLNANKLTQEFPLESTQSIDISEILNNQLIVYEKTSESSVKIRIAKIQSACVQLKGLDSSYKLFISSNQFQFGINLLINIAVTNTPMTIIHNNQILTQNIVPKLTSDVQSFPIEKFITGNLLNNELFDDRLQMTNIRFNQLIPYTVDQAFSIRNIIKFFHTEGIFSSIAIRSNSDGNNQFLGISVIPIQNQIKIYQSKFISKTSVDNIDNYGVFSLITSAKENQAIYISYINGDNLEVYQLPSFSCPDKIKFASDPSSNIVFIICQGTLTQIKYEQNLAIKSDVNLLSITSQTQLNFNANNFNHLICIKGKLFIYSGSQIALYDYRSKQFGNAIISVPQLVNDSSLQELVLFKDSFIVTASLNSTAIIKQYSYNNFQGVNPIQLRELYSNQFYKMNTPISVMALRDDLQYLLVQTSDKKYAFYRVNDSYSQNQLYFIAEIPSYSDYMTVFNSRAICILHTQQSEKIACSKILENTHLSYQLNLNNIDEDTFNENQVMTTNLKLNLQSAEQKYKIQVIRDANTDNGVIDLDDIQLIDLRQKMIANHQSDTELIIDLDDRSIYNACILGWDNYNDTRYSIINRMTKIQEDKLKYVQTSIFNNFKVSVGLGEINFGDLLKYTDERIVEYCHVLEEQGSKKSLNSTSISADIYIICLQEIQKLQMAFSLNSSNDQFTSAQIKSVTKIAVAGQYNKITQVMTIGDQLSLFGRSNSERYLLQDNKLTPIQFYLSSPLTQKLVQSLNKMLSFYQNGNIHVANMTNPENIVQTPINLRTLLEKHSFFVDESDEINSVSQSTDTLFRIQYKNSFIYQVELTIDTNLQLDVLKASLFYYSDAFQQFEQGISNRYYTVFFGYNKKSKLKAILYDNEYEENGHNLIRTAYDFSNLKFSYAEFISSSKFNVYFEEKIVVTISIQDTVGIRLPPYMAEISTYEQLLHPVGQPRKGFNFTDWPEDTRDVKPLNPWYTVSFSSIILFPLMILYFIILY